MEKQGNKAVGIVGIVLGAASILGCAIPFFFIVGIVGLILAIVSKKSFNEAGQTSPVPTVALVLSIIGIVSGVIVGTIVLCTVCAVGTYASTPEGQKAISDVIASATSSVAR